MGKAYLHIYLDSEVVFVRLLGYGFQIKNSEMPFSERSGQIKVYKLPCGWRFRFFVRGDI